MADDKIGIFLDFVDTILSYIPEEYKTEAMMNSVQKILVSASYTAPEVMWDRKKQFCVLLDKHLPKKSNPELPWQKTVCDLIRLVKL